MLDAKFVTHRQKTEHGTTPVLYWITVLILVLTLCCSLHYFISVEGFFQLCEELIIIDSHMEEVVNNLNLCL